MTYKLIFCLVSLFSCHRSPPLTSNDSATKGLASDIYQIKFKEISGNYPIGDAKSIKWLRELSDFQRALITVSADRAATAELKGWDTVKVPYVEVPSGALELETVIQKHEPRPKGDASYENLATYFSKKKTGDNCSMIIPYHPDTVQKPPLVEMFASGTKIDYLNLNAFRSMSRSLFVINDQQKNNNMPLLFSIKMGTDTVLSQDNNLQNEPNKLLGLQKEVYLLNEFGKTSILTLAREEGIHLLNDSVGLNFAKKSASKKDNEKDKYNNGIIMGAVVFLQ